MGHCGWEGLLGRARRPAWVADRHLFGEGGCNLRVRICSGAYQFLSAPDRKLNKQPLSLNIPAALTGKNPANAESCSKSEMPPICSR